MNTDIERSVGILLGFGPGPYGLTEFYSIHQTIAAAKRRFARIGRREKAALDAMLAEPADEPQVVHNGLTGN